jgi:hypothetical protein
MANSYLVPWEIDMISTRQERRNLSANRDLSGKRAEVGSEDYIVNSVIVPLPTQDVTLVDFQGDQTT